MRLPVNTVIHATLVGLEPATFRSLVDCWSDALPVVPPTHRTVFTTPHLFDTLAYTGYPLEFLDEAYPAKARDMHGHGATVR